MLPDLPFIHQCIHYLISISGNTCYYSAKGECPSAVRPTIHPSMHSFTHIYQWQYLVPLSYRGKPQCCQTYHSSITSFIYSYLSVAIPGSTWLRGNAPLLSDLPFIHQWIHLLISISGNTCYHSPIGESASAVRPTIHPLIHSFTHIYQWQYLVLLSQGGMPHCCQTYHSSINSFIYSYLSVAIPATTRL